MASKIQNELVGVTGYVWNTGMSDSENRHALCKSTYKLPDDEYDQLSAEARGFVEAVGDAAKNAKPIPNWPDAEVAPKAKAKDEPAPKAKAKAKDEPAPKAKAKAKVEAEDEPAPKAKAKAKVDDEFGDDPIDDEPAPKAKAPKAPKAAKPKDDEDESTSDAPERGKTVYTFRKITLLNPTWKKKEVAEECARLGFPVTPSTASLLWYGTRHTKKVMEDLNMI